jgi:hypothetical protein
VTNGLHLEGLYVNRPRPNSRAEGTTSSTALTTARTSVFTKASGTRNPMYLFVDHNRLTLGSKCTVYEPMKLGLREHRDPRRRTEKGVFVDHH